MVEVGNCSNDRGLRLSKLVGLEHVVGELEDVFVSISVELFVS